MNCAEKASIERSIPAIKMTMPAFLKNFLKPIFLPKNKNLDSAGNEKDIAYVRIADKEQKLRKIGITPEREHM